MLRVSSDVSGEGSKEDELQVGDVSLQSEYFRSLSPEGSRKVKARLRQQRCRSKRRAVEQAQKQRFEGLWRDLLQARDAAADKSKQTLVLRANLSDLTAQIKDIRARLLQLHYAGCEALPLKPGCHALPPEPEPTRQTFNVINPGEARSHPSHSDTRDTACCAESPCSIFAAAPHLRERKHRRLLSTRHVDTSQPYAAAVAAYRSTVAQQLGVGVQDIEWLVVCTLYPDITKHGGVGTCWNTPEGVATTTTVWLACLIENTLLLAVQKRLEQLRDEHPDHLSPDFLPDLTSPADAADIAWSNLTSCENANVNILAETSTPNEEPPSSIPAWAFDDEPTSRHADVDVLVHNLHSMFLENTEPPRPVQRTGEIFLQSAHKVFADIFAAHLPWLAASDCARLCKRLRRSFASASSAGSLAGQTARDSQTSAGSFLSVFSTLDGVLKAVLSRTQLHPAARKLPASLQEILSALQATEERLTAVAYEVGLIFGTITADNPAPMREIVCKYSAITLGYVEFERLNLAMWKMLELSTEQKAALAQLWAAFRRRQKRDVADFDDAARLLLDFPSPADLHLGSVYAVLQLAERMYQSDVASAASLGSADGLGTSSAAAEFDPFTKWQQSSESPKCGSGAGMSERRDVRATNGGGRHEWMEGLLGVCPEATDAAARLLASLRQVQAQKNALHIEFMCFMQGILTSKQCATLMAGLFPFRADSFRIVGMACTEACCQRVFGRPAICG